MNPQLQLEFLTPLYQKWTEPASRKLIRTQVEKEIRTKNPIHNCLKKYLGIFGM
jgi:hypothetical protein